MHHPNTAPPCAGLAGYVRAYAQFEICASSPDVVQSVPASLESMLEFDYPGAGNEPRYSVSLTGPQTGRRVWMRLRGPVESFRVFFKPLALWQLCRVPPALLVDRSHAGEAILGVEIASLAQCMAAHRSFPERVRLVEEYLLRRTASPCSLTAVIASAHHIIEMQGKPAVAALATREGLCVRQFERRFLREMGMPPKLFSRIVRYQLALDSKLALPGRSWLGIAHEFGYHDQTHMVREFQSLGGASPGGLLRDLSDTRPGAPVSRGTGIGIANLEG